MLVGKGVVVSNNVRMDKQYLQLYNSGVVLKKQCLEMKDSAKSMYIAMAITGYDRIGKNGSGPFWKVRGSFGPNWGMNGSMRIQREIGDINIFGPCNLHYVVQLPIARKY